MMVNYTTGIFMWKSNDIDYLYKLSDYGPRMFYSIDGIRYQSIINSGWLKNDFLSAIKYWEKYTVFNIFDLKQNIGKYLDEIIIRDIIV